MTMTVRAAPAEQVAAGAANPGARVLRGALTLLSTQPLTWTVSLLAAALLPRFLGARGLGEYTAAFTVASIGAVVASFGLPSFIVRQTAHEPRAARSLAGAGVVLTALLSLASAAILTAVLPHVGLPVRPRLLMIVLAGMTFGSVQSVVLSVLIGQERHRRYAWLNALTAAIPMCVGLAVLVAGGSVVLFAAGVVATSAIGLGACWRLSGLHLDRSAFTPRLWRTVVSGGVPFLGWSLVVNVYGQIDQVLLAIFTHTSEVGWYAAAYRIISIPVFIPTLITTPLLPALSRNVHDRQLFAQTLRGSFIAAMVLTVPIAAMIIGLAPDVPALLHWPAEFSASVPLIMILALHQPFVAADMVLATGLTALHRERQWLRVGIVAAVLNPALNIALIPLMERQLHNGAVAAAAITVGTELFMFGAALFLLPTGIISRPSATVTGRVIAAGVLTCVVAAALRGTSLPIAVVAGGLTFSTAVLVSRAVSADDLKVLAMTATRRGWSIGGNQT